MRLAFVSDIHGNLTALQAVIADLKRASPDVVVQGGDLVMNGHRPAEVVDRVRELGWANVQGNTDEALWAPEKLSTQLQSSPKIKDLLESLFQVMAPATRHLLGEERLRWLQSLPQEWRQEDVAFVHASPGNLWKAPMPDATDEELVRTYGPLKARLAVYGHIHRPYVRQLPGFVVANTGSAGLPWDGDPRACYLLVDDGEATVRRVEYDIEAEIKSSLASSYPRPQWLAKLRREARYAPPF